MEIPLHARALLLLASATAPRGGSSGRRYINSKASQKKAAPKAKTGAKPAAAKTAVPASKQAKPAAKARKAEARDGSKKSAVLDLLRRKEGATAAEITKVTKWQAHSIRGFISGTISKKMKLTVESVRNEQGERVYKVK